MTAAATRPLAFTLTEDEAVSCWRIVTDRQMRATQVSLYSWGAVFLIAPLIGLIVAVAHGLGMISFNELKPVLIASFAAFFAGVAVNYVAISRTTIRHLRVMHRIDGALPCELTCDEAGLRWKTLNTDASNDWKAITAVEEAAGFVFIWAGMTPVISIPHRIFEKPSEREAFVSRVRRFAKLS
jgi:hypothetical protein